MVSVMIVDQPHRIRTFKESRIPRRQAREFPGRPDVEQKIQHNTYNRLWSRERVYWPANTRAHIIPRT